MIRSISHEELAFFIGGMKKKQRTTMAQSKCDERIRSNE